MNMHKASTLDAQLDAAIKAVLPWLALKTQVVLWPRSEPFLPLVDVDRD